LAPSGEQIANKLAAKISTSGIAIAIMLHGYSRQRRTIGSFTATAGLL